MAFIFWLVALVFSAAFLHTLWSGKFYLRNRQAPFTRSDQPYEYWGGTALMAFASAIAIFMAFKL